MSTPIGKSNSSSTVASSLLPQDHQMIVQQQSPFQQQQQPFDNAQYADENVGEEREEGDGLIRITILEEGHLRLVDSANRSYFFSSDELRRRNIDANALTDDNIHEIIQLALPQFVTEQKAPNNDDESASPNPKRRRSAEPTVSTDFPSTNDKMHTNDGQAYYGPSNHQQEHQAQQQQQPQHHEAASSSSTFYATTHIANNSGAYHRNNVYSGGQQLPQASPKVLTSTNFSHFRAAAAASSVVSSMSTSTNAVRGGGEHSGGGASISDVGIGGLGRVMIGEEMEVRNAEGRVEMAIVRYYRPGTGYKIQFADGHFEWLEENSVLEMKHHQSGHGYSSRSGAIPSSSVGGPSANISIGPSPTLPTGGPRPIIGAAGVFNQRSPQFRRVINNAYGGAYQPLHQHGLSGSQSSSPAAASYHQQQQQIHQQSYHSHNSKPHHLSVASTSHPIILLDEEDEENDVVAEFAASTTPVSSTTTTTTRHHQPISLRPIMVQHSRHQHHHNPVSRHQQHHQIYNNSSRSNNAFRDTSVIPPNMGARVSVHGGTSYHPTDEYDVMSHDGGHEYSSQNLDDAEIINANGGGGGDTMHDPRMDADVMEPDAVQHYVGHQLQQREKEVEDELFLCTACDLMHPVHQLSYIVVRIPACQGCARLKTVIADDEAVLANADSNARDSSDNASIALYNCALRQEGLGGQPSTELDQNQQHHSHEQNQLEIATHRNDQDLMVAHNSTVSTSVYHHHNSGISNDASNSSHYVENVDTNEMMAITSRDALTLTTAYDDEHAYGAPFSENFSSEVALDKKSDNNNLASEPPLSSDHRPHEDENIELTVQVDDNSVPIFERRESQQQQKMKIEEVQ